VSTPALIHVVDDDDSLRRSLLRLLEAAGFEARGYSSAGDFLLHPLSDRPGCVLLDVRMPGPSGFELHTALKQQAVGLPVVFLTGHGDLAMGVQAMKAGAVDFLTKPFDRDALLSAIERALARDASQRASRREAAALRARFGTLTPRERDVCDRVVAGKLNKQIAGDLGVSERTVKTHRARLMGKLEVKSVAELGQLSERLRHLSEEDPAAN
jgi:FixJ family two-component response regulator